MGDLRGNISSPGSLRGMLAGLEKLVGPSAYQVAVNNGFEGTEEEWLESLRGGPGDPGVFVSETEPTDPDVLVWINPAGEAIPGGGGDGYVDLSGYAKEEWVEDYVQEKIAEAEFGGGGGGGEGVDLSDYALKTELPTKVSQLTNDAGYLTAVPDGYAKEEDIPTKLSELTGDSTHRTVTDAEKTAWNNKSDFSGAYSALTGKPTIPSKTSQLTNDSGFLTAVPSGYATEDYVKGKIAEAELGGGDGESIDLTGYALKSELPTKTSQLTNDSGYLTAVPDGYAKTEDIPTSLAELAEDTTHRTVTDEEIAEWSGKSDFTGNYNDLTGKPTIPTKTSQLTNDSNFLTQHQSLSGYAKTSDIPTALSDLTADASHRTVTDTEKSAWNAKSNFSGNYNDLTNKPTIPSAYTHPSSHPASMITGLATVATSGSYNDLTNKPTIPSAYSHPASHPASMITGLATVATSGSYDDLSDKPSTFTPDIHNHSASEVTSGTFAAARIPSLAASKISAGTFAGQVVANASGQDPGTALIRNIQASPTDLEAGVSQLATGTIYIVFEE